MAEPSPAPLVPTRLAWAVTLVAIAIGVALRFTALGRHDLWVDEGVSVYTSTCADVMDAVVRGGAELPAYPYLLAGWMRIGASIEWLRGLSALLGSIALVVWVGFVRRHFGPQTGAATAVLAASSSFLVYYSQEVRTYALLLLLSCVALGSLLEIARSTRRRPWAWAAYSGALVVGTYDHYFWWLFSGCVFCSGFLFARIRTLWKAWVLCHVAVATAFLPWLPNFVHSLLGFGGSDLIGPHKSWVRDLGSPFVVFSLGKSLIPTRGTPHFPPEAAAFALGLGCSFALAILGAIRLRRAGRRDVLGLILLLNLVPVLALTTATHFGPALYNHTRVKYLIYSSPAFLLLLAEGVTFLLEGRRRWSAAFLAGGLVLSNGLSLWNYFENPEYLRAPAYREAAEYLHERLRPREPIVTAHIWCFTPLWFTLGRLDPDVQVFPIGGPGAIGPSRWVERPDRLGLRRGDTYWLVLYQEWRTRAPSVEARVPPEWATGDDAIEEVRTFRGLEVRHVRRMR